MNAAQFHRALEVHANPQLGAVFLNSPLSDDELRCWQQENRQITLPADLVAFYKLHNGVRIYANGEADDWEGDDGFPILFPLRRWQYAAREMYWGNTSMDEYIPGSWLALGTDQDGSAFIVLDTATASYLVVEPIDPEPERVATNVAELLDWLYDRYVLNA